jgi:hypothetical protein
VGLRWPTGRIDGNAKKRHCDEGSALWKGNCPRTIEFSSVGRNKTSSAAIAIRILREQITDGASSGVFEISVWNWWRTLMCIDPDRRWRWRHSLCGANWRAQRARSHDEKQHPNHHDRLSIVRRCPKWANLRANINFASV